jgi:hypothetical protein
VEVAIVWLNLIGHFSPIVPPFADRGLSSRLTWSASGDKRGKLKRGQYNKSRKAAVHLVGNRWPHTEDEDEYLWYFPTGLPTKVGVCLRHCTSHTVHLYFVQLSCLVTFSPTSTVWFPGAFTKLRKAIISFVISVRPSICLFVRLKTCLLLVKIHKGWYFCIFRKFVQKIHLSSKSDENYGHFTCKPTYIFIVSRSVLFRMRNVSYRIVEQIKTHILYSTTYFRNFCRLWGMWKNIVERGRPQMSQYVACTLHAVYLRL